MRSRSVAPYSGGGPPPCPGTTAATPSHVEAGHQVADGIAGLAPGGAGRLGEGVTVGDGEQGLGAGDLGGGPGLGAGDLFELRALLVRSAGAVGPSVCVARAASGRHRDISVYPFPGQRLRP